MWKRLERMLVKEGLQIVRDKRMRLLVFAMPVMMMLVMSFAMTTDLRQAKLVVLDLDRTPSSRKAIRSFVAGRHFSLGWYVSSPEELKDLMDRGDTRAALWIPRGFEADILSRRGASIQILLDGTYALDSGTILSAASAVIRGLSEELLSPDSVAGAVDLRLRNWFNSNLDSERYYVPGLIAMMLTLQSLMVAGISIVREKEIGTIEQIMVTPIRGIEFILGKTLPYMAMAYLIMTAMLVIAFIVFDVPFRGSLPLLYALTAIFLAGNLGCALLISVSATTQQQALLTAFFFLMPAVLLSGFVFPVRNMPIPVQWLTALNPLRWYLEIMQAILSKGVGLADLIPQISAQTVLAVVSLTAAAKGFHKTLS